MEIIVILAAVAALVFAALVLAFGHSRNRRPPLRLPHEQELEDRGDELFRDFDQDLAGALEQATRGPEAQAAFPERLAVPDAPRPRPQGRLTIDHDPAEPGLTPDLPPRRPGPRETGRDGESR